MDERLNELIFGLMARGVTPLYAEEIVLSAFACGVDAGKGASFYRGVTVGLGCAAITFAVLVLLLRL